MRLTVLFAVLIGLPAVSLCFNPLLFFECGSGELLPIQWTCNGQADCDDSSDEDNCVCSYGEFHCGSGECIGMAYRCDDILDCQDDSDEVNCGFVTPPKGCSSSEFTCANGACIRSAFVCDGEEDCSDGSDESAERNCTVGCREHQFSCSDGEECIPSNWRCDTEADCSDGSDEVDCFGTNFECGFGFFNCTNFGCIDINLVCDGSQDCPQDNSDEENCPNGGQACYSHEFRCADPNRGCIHMDWRCDGEDDCGDYSDEIDCVGVCASYQFECTTGGCANLTSRCDGNIDCQDGSDEYVCPYPPPRLQCQDTQFSCEDGQGCIAITQVCDGVEHCRDGSDEVDRMCNQSIGRSCDRDNGGCDHFCRLISSRRAICTCRHGYQLDANLTSCNDIDECDYPYQCSQYCHNTPGGFNCSCADGYVLHPTRGCQARGDFGPPVLLLANREDIRSYPLHSNGSSSILIRDLHNCMALDFHYQYGYLYWTDVSQSVIKRAKLDGTQITTIIGQDLAIPGGLAVDWVSDKLYWTDSGSSRIEVADIDGTNRTVLFSTDLSEPRAIVVDPAVGYMFWTDWGENPKIERATMDGKNRTVLHSIHLFWPNALTADFVTRSLYWADAKLRVIESCSYNGSRRRPILIDGVRHVFALSLFEDTLYWTEWETRSIFSTHKGVGRYISLVSDTKVSNNNVTQVDTDLFRPMDVHVVHPLRQRRSSNPCDEGNGGCEYMCLLSPSSPEGYACACPTGIELDEDGRSCKPLDSFLLFAHRSDIRRVSLDTDVPVAVILPVVNMTGSMALDWDHQTNQLFWTDIFQDSISVSKLDGTNQRVLLTRNIQTPAGLAVDWLTRKLYWTDDADDTERIEVSEFDGSNRAIVVYGNMDKPRDIVVHPTAGVMFWTDWGKNPRIERANLDGTERVAIVSNDIGFPNGLAIDYELERLYWCDGDGFIEFSDFNGSNRTTVLDVSHLHLFGLTLHEEWLYFTEWNRDTLFRVDKHTGGQLQTVVQGLDQPMDVHVFHKNRTILLDHPCMENNGNCSHLCLSRPSETGGLLATCVCPTGYNLMEDGVTCKSHIDNFLLFPTETHLRQISLDTPYLANVILPMSGVRAVVSADVDIVTDNYYWADVLESKIYRAPQSGGEPEVFVGTGIEKPESLMVDWIGRNLYWADSALGRIEVAQLESGTRYVLVSKNLHHVNALVIDLRSHRMFWIDAGDTRKGIPPRIEKSTMDGTGREVIVTENLQQPRGIAVDNYFGLGARVYWTDSLKGTIESAAFDGSSREIVIVFPEESSASPLGITIFGDHIYWTDFTTNSVNRARKSDGSEQVAIIKGLPAVSSVTVVSKVNLDKKATFNHGCDDEQQRCSDICLPNVATSIFTCACPTGIQLKNDRSCSDFPDEYVLVPTRTSIRRVSLDMEGDFNDVTILDGLTSVLVLDYVRTSRTDGKIVFGDSELNTIYTCNFNGTDKRAIVHNVSTTDGLAVDWVNHNLYWTEFGSKTIQVARLDGRHRKVLFRERVEKPRAIALHPSRGLMFWSDWRDDAVIEIAQMDGTNRQIIVSSGIKWPNGLGIDREESRLYWVDGKRGYQTLASCDYNGLNRRTIVRHSSGNLRFPFGVVFFRGFVFWTDWILRGLYRTRVSSSFQDVSNEKLIQQFSTQPFQPIIVSSQHIREGELTSSGVCGNDNGGCPYLCLPHNETMRTCVCPDNTPSCTESTDFLPVTMDTAATPTTPPPVISESESTVEDDSSLTTPTGPSYPPDVGQNFPDFTTRVTVGATGATTSEATAVLAVSLTTSEWFMLIFGLLILTLLVVIIVGGLLIAKWLHNKNKETAPTTVRFQATNPHYCTSDFGDSSSGKLNGSNSNSLKTSPEKVIGNLLPKRHNNDPQRRPPSPTSANLFVEKKDHYNVSEPPRKKRPKPPRALPKSASLRPEESPSPPLPLKHPQKIPPCSSAPIPKQIGAMAPAPKRTSSSKGKMRSKTVRFDASVPPEEEPPPLPRKGIPIGSKDTPPLLPKVVNTGISNRGVSWTDSDTSDTTVLSEGDGKRPLIRTPSAPPPSTSSTSGVLSVNLNESESSC